METILEGTFGRALAEPQVLEFFRYVGQIGDGRHLMLLKGLDHNGILDGRSQGVPGVSFGIGDSDVAVVVREGLLQGRHLGRGAAAPGGCKGFMRHEDHAAGVVITLQAVTVFDPAHKAFHFLGQVSQVDLGGVIGAVADIGAQNLGLAVQPPILHPVFALHDEGNGAGA